MTKLPPDGERVIRQLDDLDKIDDADPQMEWLQREPYLTRGRWLWSAFRDMREAVVSLVHIVKAIEPRLPHQRISLDQLRRFGLLERRAPPKRTRRGHPLDLAVDDVHRARDILRRGGKKRQRRDDKVTAELIAAERNRRLMHGSCTVDKLGEGDKYDAEEWQVCAHTELRDMDEKLHRRMQGMGGTTGAERNREVKLSRAK